MEKTERIEMLKLGFRTNGGIPFVSGAKRRPIDPVRPPRAYNHWSPFLGRIEANKEWVKRADKFPKPLINPRRAQRISPLIRIVSEYFEKNFY